VSGNMLFLIFLTMYLIPNAFKSLHYPTNVIAQCVRR
jgi:hypothetical protein